MKTITAEHAAELILELLKANSWLNAPGVMTKDDFHAKDEAILFLQQMATHGASSFGDTSQSAQRIISGFLLDFMSKLMHPGHPLNRKSWQVDGSKLMPEQGLQIIAAEIIGNQLRPQSVH
ncbi:MAG: hypothetical protein K2Q13_07895 [Nitrosomonas sp.]|uniref:hypothetical protein n=1 Tax=Nitrosomonas sp. TaxID=42353 RepID=UPI0025FBAA34|nr:hypothetical protein [Nitrosomonas sp.]MBY0474965.1 hypothetical protein [Nitrosomonas sp.]